MVVKQDILSTVSLSIESPIIEVVGLYNFKSLFDARMYNLLTLYIALSFRLSPSICK